MCHKYLAIYSYIVSRYTLNWIRAAITISTISLSISPLCVCLEIKCVFRETFTYIWMCHNQLFLMYRSAGDKLYPFILPFLLLLLPLLLIIIFSCSEICLVSTHWYVLYCLISRSTSNPLVCLLITQCCKCVYDRDVRHKTNNNKIEEVMIIMKDFNLKALLKF